VTRPIVPTERPPGDAGRAPHVVITGGGGGYPGTVAFYNLALEACARLRTSLPAIEPVLVSGPLFHEWLDLRLVDGVRLLPFDPHLNGRIAAADLVICQGGYNTLAEIAALGVPALCVPAERQSDDQFERARDMTSPIMTCYTGTDPRAMADLAIALLQTRPARSRATVVTTPGAGIAARLLLDVLDAVSVTTCDT
jgi:predicted glycosyltransferase